MPRPGPSPLGCHVLAALVVLAPLAAVRPARGGAQEPSTTAESPPVVAQAPTAPDGLIPTDVRSLAQQATAALKSGAIAEALRLQQQLVGWVENHLPPVHPFRADTFSTLGVVFSVLGRQAEALAAFQTSERIYRQLVISNPIHRKDLARCLSNTAALLAAVKRTKEVIPVLQEASTIYRDLSQSHSDHLAAQADTLDNLALAYGRLGQHDQALSVSLDSVRLHRLLASSNPPGDRSLVAALCNLSNHTFRAGRLLDAIQSSAECVHVARALLAARRISPLDLSRALMIHAVHLESNGQWLAVLPVVDEVSAIHASRLPGHPDSIYPYALSRLKTGVALRRLARTSESRLATEAAVRALRQIPAPDADDLDLLAGALMNLGVAYDQLGLLQEALDVAREAVALNRKLAAIDSSNIEGLASTLVNYGFALSKLGRAAEALAPTLEGVALRRRIGGTDEDSMVLLARDLHNLSHIQAIVGRPQDAFASLNDSLKLRRLLAQSNSNYLPDLALTLSGMASIYGVQGRFDDALRLITEAVAIQRKLSQANAFHLLGLSRALMVQGKLQSEKWNLQAGDASLGEAVSILQSLTKQTPGHLDDLIDALEIHADLVVRSGDLPRAIAIHNQLLTTEFAFFQIHLPGLPEARRQALVDLLGSRWQRPFTFASQSPAAADLAMRTRINRHGLLLEIERRQALLERAGEGPKQLARRVSALTRQLANGIVLPTERQRVVEERERLERDLYKLLPQVKLELASPAMVARHLAADSVLVEFQRYEPFNPAQQLGERLGQARYLAMVLDPTGRIQVVDLGLADPLEHAITTALDATRKQRPEAEQRWSQVAAMVLQPVRAVTAGRRQFLLVADGELHRVPFSALPVLTASSGVLPSDASLRTLGSGRDLLPRPGPVSRARAPLVLANPATQGWPPLPAAAQEGAAVAARLGVPLHQGSSARVGLVEQSIGPRVLHVAGHGYFDEQAQGDPLLASGLVLAGADSNRLPSRVAVRSAAGSASAGAAPLDDGYLTAKEAARLQLDGTELVVLSACDTGVGQQRTGEGVFGLQRALSVAGARGTLLSLWKVPDEASQTFMERLYSLLNQGVAADQAVRQVQAEFRSQPTVGGKPKPGGWSDPFYWAAWQFSGVPSGGGT